MVARDRPDLDEMWRVIEELRSLVVAANTGFTSITRGSLRVASNEGLKVEGSARVDGWLIVTGTERVTGLLEILGQLTGSGTLTWTGPASFSGAMGITGTVTVQGGGKIIVAGGSSPATLENGALSFGTGGRLEADVANGGIRMIVGSSSQVYAGSGGSALRYGVTNAVIVNSAGTTVGGPLMATGGLQTSGGSKQFVMDHPTKPGMTLHHASTESPVSGIEYWGEAALDESGAAVIELPEYFEALAKPEGRAVLVSAIDDPYPIAASRVSEGKFTVRGAPNGEFAWTVKAERIGADFETESVGDLSSLGLQ